MATIYISIGSNINPQQNIQLALRDLREHFQNIRLSSSYESKAVGFEGDNFINLVAAAETDLKIPQVVQLFHDIEDQHGRDRQGPRFSSRTIDLDLLLYDNAVFTQDGIEIPREEILQNAFVLCPLAELLPDGVHPVTGKRYDELWASFDQSSQPLWRIDDMPLTVK